MFVNAVKYDEKQRVVKKESHNDYPSLDFYQYITNDMIRTLFRTIFMLSKDDLLTYLLRVCKLKNGDKMDKNAVERKDIRLTINRFNYEKFVDVIDQIQIMRTNFAYLYSYENKRIDWFQIITYINNCEVNFLNMLENFELNALWIDKLIIDQKIHNFIKVAKTNMKKLVKYFTDEKIEYITEKTRTRQDWFDEINSAVDYLKGDSDLLNILSPMTTNVDARRDREFMSENGIGDLHPLIKQKFVAKLYQSDYVKVDFIIAKFIKTMYYRYGDKKDKGLRLQLLFLNKYNLIDQTDVTFADMDNSVVMMLINIQYLVSNSNREFINVIRGFLENFILLCGKLINKLIIRKDKSVSSYHLLSEVKKLSKIFVVFKQPGQPEITSADISRDLIITIKNLLTLSNDLLIAISKYKTPNVPYLVQSKLIVDTERRRTKHMEELESEIMSEFEKDIESENKTKEEKERNRERERNIQPATVAHDVSEVNNSPNPYVVVETDSLEKLESTIDNISESNKQLFGLIIDKPGDLTALYISISIILNIDLSYLTAGKFPDWNRAASGWLYDIPRFESGNHYLRLKEYVRPENYSPK
jgi:hypothetical protein